MSQSYDFASIYGQEAAVGHLQNALRTGHISHAYILCGEKGSGRMRLALTFARTLQCQHPGEKDGLIEACGECRSCQQALGNNQPDIITVDPMEKSKSGALKIKEARARIKDDILIRPYSSPWKIYIIPDADKLNAETQNMLLKTLEEPPSYAVLLLLAENTDHILPTVLSRCITLRLHPVKEELIAQHLEQEGIPEERALLCARLSHGNPGRAENLARDEASWQFRQDSVRFLEKITGTDTFTILSFVTPFSREQTDAFLDICESWLRDLAFAKIKGSLIFQDEAAYLNAAAAMLRLSDIQKGLDAVRLARERRAANGNDAQVLEMLLLSLRSTLHRTSKVPTD